MSRWFWWTWGASFVGALASCTSERVQPASDAAAGGSAGEGTATGQTSSGGGGPGGGGAGGSGAGGSGPGGSGPGGSGPGGSGPGDSGPGGSGLGGSGPGGSAASSSGPGATNSTTTAGGAGTSDGGVSGTGTESTGAGGSGTPSTSTGGAGGSVECSGGLVACDDECIDPASNQEHCGASGDCQGDDAGDQCDPAHPCRAGVCASWEAPVALQAEPGPTCRWLDLAMNDDGLAALAWYESLGGGTNVWASLYAPETGWADPEPLEATHGKPDDDPPSVALNQEGTAMVVWDSFDAENVRTLLSSRHEAGSSWESGELVDPDGTLGSCEVALAPSGNAVVVCSRYASGVQWNHYTEEQGWGIPETLSFLYYVGGMRVATNPSGTAVATWHHYDGDEYSNERILVASFDAEARSAWATQVGPSHGSHPWSPDVAIDHQGNVVAVWGDDWLENLASRRYSVDTGWASEMSVSWLDFRQAPRVGMDRTGNAIVAWFTNNSLWASRYSIESGWADPEVIGNQPYLAPEDDRYTLRLAVGAAGDAVVVWPELVRAAPMSGENSNIQLWSNRYTPEQGWGTPELIDVAFAGNTLSFDVAMDAQGNAIVAWSPEEYPTYELLVSRSSRPE